MSIGFRLGLAFGLQILVLAAISSTSLLFNARVRDSHQRAASETRALVETLRPLSRAIGDLQVDVI